MPIDYQTLEALRQNHPAWRLLNSPHAPLIASFFQKVFVDNNARILPQATLVEALEDELFHLREVLGDGKFPKSAQDYLDDWAAPEKGWLRKFYRHDSDEAQFDLTPATEKAIAWLDNLTRLSFIGTESRLLTLFELLRQMSEGSDEDPQSRLQELHRRRDAINAEIAQVAQGNVAMLDDTAIKDRFMQFNQQARELLSDFREVEHNFRQLDRSVRERIATWDGKKGELLLEIMGKRDAIADSDQGASFRAFWDFLMSPERQDEFDQRLDKVLSLPVMQELKPDKRTRRIHHDWLEAGEYTQRTVAQLSQQLRRFLDDQAWLENRRIMDILHEIESKTLVLRESLFSQETLQFIEIDDAAASIELPMERPLYTPPVKPVIANIKLESGDEDVDSSVLYSQTIVDKQTLEKHLRKSLQNQTQISLGELCRTRPLQQGLAELVAYLEVGEGERFEMLIDDSVEDSINWTGTDNIPRKAKLPRIIYLRKNPTTDKHS